MVRSHCQSMLKKTMNIVELKGTYIAKKCVNPSGILKSQISLKSKQNITHQDVKVL